MRELEWCAEKNVSSVYNVYSVCPDLKYAMCTVLVLLFRGYLPITFFLRLRRDSSLSPCEQGIKGGAVRLSKSCNLAGVRTACERLRTKGYGAIACTAETSSHWRNTEGNRRLDCTWTCRTTPGIVLVHFTSLWTELDLTDKYMDYTEWWGFGRSKRKIQTVEKVTTRQEEVS